MLEQISGAFPWAALPPLDSRPIEEAADEGAAAALSGADYAAAAGYSVGAACGAYGSECGDGYGSGSDDSPLVLDGSLVAARLRADSVTLARARGNTGSWPVARRGGGGGGATRGLMGRRSPAAGSGGGSSESVGRAGSGSGSGGRRVVRFADGDGLAVPAV